MQGYHVPVMLAEVIAHLNVKAGGLYIDATLGDGGYSLEILKHGGKVLGLEIDPSVVERAVQRIKDNGYGENFTHRIGNFKNIDTLAKSAGFDQVNGIVYDLGYSSHQLEDGGKGLSFLTVNENNPLDMRLNPELGVTAADLVNALSENDLAKLIFDLSGEHMSKRIASAIVKSRNLKKIRTTGDLVRIIESVSPSGYEHGRISPATRTFQALRIAVNDEISNLEESLPRAARLLLPGGRIEIVSFHSLEDRVAKQFGREAQPTLQALFKNPLEPTEAEIALNNRSRSAKLRVYEKTN